MSLLKLEIENFIVDYFANFYKRQSAVADLFLTFFFCNNSARFCVSGFFNDAIVSRVFSRCVRAYLRACVPRVHLFAHSLPFPGKISLPSVSRSHDAHTRARARVPSSRTRDHSHIRRPSSSLSPSRSTAFSKATYAYTL